MNQPAANATTVLKFYYLRWCVLAHAVNPSPLEMADLFSHWLSDENYFQVYV